MGLFIGAPESASWSPLAVVAALGLLIAVATGRPALAADLENGEAIFNGNCTACHPMAWFWMKVAAKRVLKNKRHPTAVRKRAMYLRRILCALSRSKPKKQDRRKDDDKKKDDDKDKDRHDEEVGRWMMSLAALRPRKT